MQKGIHPLKGIWKTGFNCIFKADTKMMKSIKLIVPLLILLSACGPGRRVVKRELPEISVSANDGRQLYRAASPILWDIQHSRVALSFNWQEKTVDGRAWIDIHPYFYATDTLVLDAKGMRIDSVTLVNNDRHSPLNYSYADDRILIKFSQKYEASKSIQLYIRYKAMPYANTTGGSAAIASDRGLYFINTEGAIPNKPRQIWTQGETEANSHWLPTIDKPNERFTVQVELTVPDTMQTLGNGIKKKSEASGKGLRTDIWLMDKPIQAYAVMFAIGKFAIVRDKWENKEVNYYVEHEYAPYAAKMFNNTPEMMGFFSEVTGVPYPWQKYDQIVVRDYVSGAMENTTASLYGEFMNQNFREIADKNYEDIVSHELFHQWFGDYVTQESWSNLTVSESFANYGEQLWRKYKYGKESADKLAYEDLLKYINSKEYSPELVRFHYTDKEDMFDRISYEKGGAVLNYLHGLMGDAAFYKAMNIYLTRNALSSAEATHWRLAVEEATGRDWNWFFNQFYYRGGHPNLEIQYAYDDAKQQLTVQLRQAAADSGAAYELPLKTAVLYGTEKTIIDWNLSKKNETFTYSYKNGVKPVIVPDVMHWLPGTIKEHKSQEQWLAQFQGTDDYISKRRAIAEAMKNLKDENAKKLIDKALGDKSAPVRALAMQYVATVKDDAYAQSWKSTAEFLAANDPSTDVRASSFDALGQWKVSSAKAEMIRALGDSSYKIAGSALNALNKIEPDTAYAFAGKILEDQPKAELRATVESIIAKRGEVGDMTYFEHNAPYVYGGRKLQFSSVFAGYLSQVKDEQVFDRGLQILAGMAKTESIQSYRSYIVHTIIYLGEAPAKKTANTEARRGRVKKYADELLQSEPDAGNKDQYRKAIAETFSEKRGN
jgi:aminopeptidase N